MAWNDTMEGSWNKGFQLSGGFRAMILQSNGWLVYLIALISRQGAKQTEQQGRSNIHE